MLNDETPTPEGGDEASTAIVSNAQTVAHADVVTNSNKTDVATVVNHTDRVEKVEIHGEPIRSDRVRKLFYTREIARSFVVLFALLVMVVVIIDKNSDKASFEDQLKQFKNERAQSDALSAGKLECVRRYQDVIDQDTEQQLILIGEFLVVITLNPPGPEREAKVKEKIGELDRTNVDARNAKASKIEYNNQGNPLPCPLGPSVPAPTPRQPDVSEASTSSTSTTIP